jgi:hypothetical protein
VNIPQKVFAWMVAWTFFSTLLAVYSELSAMVPLLLIGLLVAYNLTDGLLDMKIRTRIGMFIYPGFALFVMIVADKIARILADISR